MSTSRIVIIVIGLLVIGWGIFSQGQKLHWSGLERVLRFVGIVVSFVSLDYLLNDSNASGALGGFTLFVVWWLDCVVETHKNKILRKKIRALTQR